MPRRDMIRGVSTMQKSSLKVLVLAGGPDRERPVSLVSGAEVAAALRQAGHCVDVRDVMPGDHSALEAFACWGGDVVFPVLHGDWGEGGGLQEVLEERSLSFVGSRAAAAALAMDKHETRLVLADHGFPIPAGALMQRGQRMPLLPPLVLKPRREGSSIDVAICRDAAAVRRARRRLRTRHHELLVERFIEGIEMTVGTLASDKGVEALPPIRIDPGDVFYDYAAKYQRDDTQYHFDTGLDLQTVEELARLAVGAHERLGCRHLARVDFIVEPDGRPWILEVNTTPGFTTHSLFPMAARRNGLDMPHLVDRLVRVALDEDNDVPATAPRHAADGALPGPFHEGMPTGSAVGGT